MKRCTKTAKKIENEIVGAYMETIGTIWGMEMVYNTWSDEHKKMVNNRIVDIRNNLIDKVNSILERDDRPPKRKEHKK